MKRIYFCLIVIVIAGTTILACRKNDYLIGGGLAEAKVDASSYDFLKNHSWHFFDTTCLIIDKANLKDVINGDVTFFVPTDYSISNYLAAKRKEVRLIDERLDFTLDTLFKYYSPQMLMDSLGIYVIPGKVNREDMLAEGKSYETIVNGVNMWVSLEEANEYQVEGLITTLPKYVFLTRIRGQKDVNGQDPTGDINLLDIKVRCQTSGIQTKNGILHVLDNSHVWMFHQ